jgi:histidinol-phosphate/aromatic aminotransferase/cobyric acid decarboxylase-like protein/adenosyl cobinamide kinase/adenosyl cobinamide phosphate guanylyltransferase
MTLTLVIGGTRSGKSARAERLARESGLPVRYIATADAGDPAMAERIRAHAARRPQDWVTVEAGLRLADALTAANAVTATGAVAASDGMCVLVDGLGVWIAGAMHRAGAFEHVPGGEPDDAALTGIREEVLAQVEELLRAADATATLSLIVVAEQAGEGVLPPERASRAWLDTLGEATQRLAERADTVELVVAGRVLNLPGTPRPGTGAGVGAGAGAGLAGIEPHDVESSAVDAGDVNQLRVHGDRAVRPGDADHAVNVLAGGPPEWLRAELRDALEQDASRYPDERAAATAIAALHGREADEIVPTNGAAEALWLIPAALRPALAACVHPGFTEAEAALRAHGIPVVRVLRKRERGFALDPGAVPAEADLVIVGNPASPSGTLDPATTLLALRRPGRVLVVDEAFMDLVPGEPATLVHESMDDVIVVRSLTKALAIPGLRAGYAVAPAALARRLREVRPPWSANALALAALAAAARRPDALAAIAERAAAEREDLERRLAGVCGLRTWPSAANFCLVEVADGPAVLDALRERKIAVRAAASFPGLGAGDLRLTARAPRENERLVAALAQAVDASTTAGERTAQLRAAR